MHSGSTQRDYLVRPFLSADPAPGAARPLPVVRCSTGQVSGWSSQIPAAGVSVDPYQTGRADLAGLLSEIRATLCDPSRSADERLRRTETLLRTLEDGQLRNVATDHRGPTHASVRGGLAPWQIRRIREFIQDRLPFAITCGDMAGVVRLSPNHFSRAFRASLGAAPHAFLIHARVERACLLMTSTRATLGQIATDCGFADQAHFNRLFRRRTGMSPGAWRRMQGESASDVAMMPPRSRSARLPAFASTGPGEKLERF